MRRAACVAAALAGLAAAGGAGAADARAANGTRTAVKGLPMPARYTCGTGTLTFGARALSGTGNAETGSSPPAKALRAFLAGSSAAPVFPPTGWRLLASRTGRREYGHGGPGQDFLFVEVAKRKVRWKATDSGHCAAYREVGGLQADGFSVQALKALTPATRTLHLVVTTGVCGFHGRDPVAATQKSFAAARAAYRKGRLGLLLLFRPPPKPPPDTVCPALAVLVPITVRLPQPLGSRTVWNASTAAWTRAPRGPAGGGGGGTD